MIRAFTISFDFEGKTHMTLASIKTDKVEDTMYSVRLYSTSLYRIFPDGILKYSATEICNGVACKRPQGTPLFKCIHESVHAHLKLAQQYE